MQTALDRNFGTKRARGLENRRIKRDKLIDRMIRSVKLASKRHHRFARVSIEPLSLFIGVDLPPGGDKLTAFPLKRQANGKPLPQYKDLSRWLKIDLLAMAMYEYGFVRFDFSIHPKLEHQWISEGRDPRAELGVRIRKELSKLSSCPDGGWEFAFVVEGWAKRDQRSKDWSKPKQTNLHVHGFAALYDSSEINAIKCSLERACGFGLRGYPKVKKKNHIRTFQRESPTYVNYLFKYARRKDDRIGYRRDFISNAGTALAEDFWNLISGRDKEFWNAVSDH